MDAGKEPKDGSGSFGFITRSFRQPPSSCQSLDALLTVAAVDLKAADYSECGGRYSGIVAVPVLQRLRHGERACVLAKLGQTLCTRDSEQWIRRQIIAENSKGRTQAALTKQTSSPLKRISRHPD
jgi:hypothetical protein